MLTSTIRLERRNLPLQKSRSTKLSCRHLTSDPRVAQHVGSRVAHRDVMLEQMSNKVLGVLADVVPVAARKVVDALLDAVEQVLLAVGTLLAALPAAVDAALAGEGTLAGEHDVDDDAERPEVAPLVVAHVVDEGLDDLGRQVLGRAHGRAQLGRRHRRRRLAVDFDAGAQVEVADFHGYY